MQQNFGEHLKRTRLFIFLFLCVKGNFMTNSFFMNKTSEQLNSFLILVVVTEVTFRPMFAWIYIHIFLILCMYVWVYKATCIIWRHTSVRCTHPYNEEILTKLTQILIHTLVTRSHSCSKNKRRGFIKGPLVVLLMLLLLH